VNEGDKLSALDLPDQDGKRRTVADLAGPKGLVLYVYPKDDTPGCTVEAKDFRDLLPEIREKGFEVAGISPDPAGSHCDFRDKYELPFPLLTDDGMAFMKAIGAYGEKTLYGKKSMGILRSTVVVDPEGRVIRHYRNVRAKGHAERVLREL
jgi:thioredoxin-dependent peroxiredoxin